MPFRKTTEDEYVWKKIETSSPAKQYLVSCLIPKGTKVYEEKITWGKGTRHDRKCRAARIVPISFYEAASNRIYSRTPLELSKVESVNHHGFYGAKRKTYTLGKTTLPHEFDNCPAQCTGGIHYFKDVKDALVWS